MPATVFVVLPAVYSFLLVDPVRSRVAFLEDAIRKDRRIIELLDELEDEQTRLEDILENSRTETTDTGTSLLSRIESLVKKLSLSEKATNMRPLPTSQSTRNAREERLEIRFVSLTFRKLLAFLDAVERLPSTIRIESLDIRKTGNSATMSVVISSLSFETGK